MFDSRLSGTGVEDRDGIEAIRLRRAAEPADPTFRGAGEVASLEGPDGVERVVVAGISARLDLDEGDHPRAAGDEVDLARAIAEVAGEDDPAVALQVFGGQVLGEPSDAMRVCHGPNENGPAGAPPWRRGSLHDFEVPGADGAFEGGLFPREAGELLGAYALGCEPGGGSDGLGGAGRADLHLDGPAQSL